METSIMEAVINDNGQMRRVYIQRIGVGAKRVYTKKASYRFSAIVRWIASAAEPVVFQPNAHMIIPVSRGSWR